LIVDRNLDWPGCFNARDLGGLRTTDGRETRRRAVVRSDNLDHLTGEGWAELRAYGVRTVIDLRNDDERPIHPEPRASGLTTVHVPLDDLDDTRFWADWANGPQFATPLYYRPFLERKPERAAAAVAAVARARPGGVVVHCGGGRDRTGLVTMLLLAMVGVAPEHIASDYELSYDRMRRLYAELEEDDQGPILQEFLRRENTSARSSILATLSSLDVEACLGSGGLGDVAAVRARLLEPARA
jgi:protein-tyrosine phosphatase